MAPRAGARSTKVSITVDGDVLREVRKIVGRGATLSGFINEALVADLRRRKLAALVEEYESKSGAITDEEVERVRASMRSR